jgi:hypothetical protein
MVADVQIGRKETPTFFLSLAEAVEWRWGVGRWTVQLRKVRLIERAVLRPVCPAAKEASLPSRSSARNHLHRFVCSCALGPQCFVRALPVHVPELMPDPGGGVLRAAQHSAAAQCRVSRFSVWSRVRSTRSSLHCECAAGQTALQRRGMFPDRIIDARAGASADVECASSAPLLAGRSCTWCESLFPGLALSLPAPLNPPHSHVAA